MNFDNGPPAPSSSEGVEVTYGSLLKLMNEKTRFRLHSHDVPYGSGSGQQSVTGFPGVDDSNGYWIVRPQSGASAKQGDPITSGSIIRLQHMGTRKWLHSHLHASPISGNLEVSCYGGQSESDTGDYWRILIEGVVKLVGRIKGFFSFMLILVGIYTVTTRSTNALLGGSRSYGVHLAFLHNKYK